MQPLESVPVRDKDGVRGTAVPASPNTSSNASQVLVQLDSG